ncbi:monothiol glutaredoxin-S17 [Selaginella moellendorffii]|nr:monothiol glutaredoxin-S17 [Selaginella moellendorffii]|eukprot:XP_002986108.2 monothiol glutaredoxin-S17 [Selaginella moellendorffii]
MALMVEEARGLAHLDEVVKAGKSVVLHFRAPWCEASKQMDVVFEQLCADTAPRARFLRVEAEEHPEISEKYSVSVVPYFVFIKNQEVIDKLEGANPAELATKVEALAGEAAPPKENGASKTEIKSEEPPPSVSGELKSKLDKLVSSKPVMLFMKGSPEEPRCGFSRNVVSLLKEESVDFGSFDILQDEEVRQGLKLYSNWPTYPQLYYKGELLGGCDVIMEMHKSGELGEALADAKLKSQENGSKAHANGSDKGPEETLEERLKKLIHSHDVMLFMKGSPSEPKCGFSKKVAGALEEVGVPFGSFDILSDEEVRQGIKSFSNWPTFPQLYVKGELIGGCDIVMEMHKSGELKEAMGATEEKEDINSRLKKLIHSSPTMLFMKGTPEEPMCGFSKKVASALKEEGIEFGSFDILSDEEVRQGLKAFSNWPTYPQLYHKGELIGGCDIIMEMKENKELKEALAS